MVAVYACKVYDMKNVVTFETACRLKEAGFPQPEFSIGQFWYNLAGAITVIGPATYEYKVGESRSYIHVLFSLLSGRSESMIPQKDDAFFAPTVTDIMECLPGYGLRYRDGSWWVSDGYVVFADENAAKAAALIWLYENQ